MKRLCFLLVLIAGALAGCGDPAPSTPIAPDVPQPDASKFSQEDINKFKAKDQGQVPR